MAKMMISMGRKQTFDRRQAETDFDCPYYWELTGPDGAHFHFWVPPAPGAYQHAKAMAQKMFHRRNVVTYSWDYDPQWKPKEKEPIGALALQKDETPSDYELRDGHTSCWVTVGNISVYIVRTDEGVDVAMYPHYNEADDPLAWCSAKYPKEGS